MDRNELYEIDIDSINQPAEYFRAAVMALAKELYDKTGFCVESISIKWAKDFIGSTKKPYAPIYARISE